MGVANHYEPPTIVTNIANELVVSHKLYRGSVPEYDDVRQPQNMRTLKLLATLTRMRVAELRGGMPPRIFTHLRSHQAAQFCPECLLEGQYHRMPWMVCEVSACVAHETLLLDRCPDCGRSISIRAIIGMKCRHCRSDLRNAPRRSISGDATGLLAQRQLHEWITGKVDGNIDRVDTFGSQPVERQYLIVDWLQQLVAAAPPQWSYVHTKHVDAAKLNAWPRLQDRTTAHWYSLWATAFKAVHSCRLPAEVLPAVLYGWYATPLHVARGENNDRPFSSLEIHAEASPTHSRFSLVEDRVQQRPS